MILSKLTLAEVEQRVPSWISFVLSSGSPPQAPAPANISVEVLVAQGSSLAAVQKNILQLPRTLLVADILFEIARQLKIGSKLPSLATLAESVRIGSKGELALSPGDDLSAAGTCKAEEYLELISANSTVVEPLLSVGAATYLFKEKTKSALRLWYRKNRFLAGDR
jgi:hypothetical protein